MGSRVQIDRRKHEVDIIEHVLEGVHTEVTPDALDRVASLDVDGFPWPLGIVASAVEVQVVAERDDSTEWSNRPRPADGRRR